MVSIEKIRQRLFGVAFEVPVIVVLLVLVGFVDVAALREALG